MQQNTISIAGTGGAAWTTTGSAISATASDASSVRQRHSQKFILAAKHRFVYILTIKTGKVHK